MARQWLHMVNYLLADSIGESSSLLAANKLHQKVVTLYTMVNIHLRLLTTTMTIMMMMITITATSATPPPVTGVDLGK